MPFYKNLVSIIVLFISIQGHTATSCNGELESPLSDDCFELNSTHKVCKGDVVFFSRSKLPLVSAEVIKLYPFREKADVRLIEGGNRVVLTVPLRDLAITKEVYESIPGQLQNDPNHPDHEKIYPGKSLWIRSSPWSEELNNVQMFTVLAINPSKKTFFAMEKYSMEIVEHKIDESILLPTRGDIEGYRHNWHVNVTGGPYKDKSRNQEIYIIGFDYKNQRIAVVTYLSLHSDYVPYTFFVSPDEITLTNGKKPVIF